MRRFILFAGIGVAVIIFVAWGTRFLMRQHTKSFSPEENLEFIQGDLKIRVFYNRPYKKGREIFGGLVPFNEVWRTGANESTTFEVNQDIRIKGNVLKAGKYSLWTIPQPGKWTVIFNSEFGQWGINSQGEANRDPTRDILTVEVPVMHHETEFEQFTIEFEQVGEDAEMVFLWNNTLVVVPITLARS